MLPIQVHDNLPNGVTNTLPMLLFRTSEQKLKNFKKRFLRRLSNTLFTISLFILKVEGKRKCSRRNIVFFLPL